MSDKFRRTEPINITFGQGEGPSNSKLNAIALQSRNGSQLLEKAVGDIWNQSGDSLLTSYPLQINNLGRTIGQIQYLNPVLYPTTNTITYTDSIGSLNTGRTDGYTQLKPSSSITIVGGSANISNLVASETLVANAGDIWVDTNTGRFRSYTPLTSADKLTYTVDTSQWVTGFEQLPSVIPDPRQTTFTGCRISQSSGNFFINLPPRQPLTLTGFDKPDRYPNSTDWTSNEATVTGNPHKMWQSPGVNALAEEHYRYSLSKEIRDLFSGLPVGTQLPNGLLYIYDQSSKTILEDVIFTTTANMWVLQISSATVDFTSKVTSTEAAASYNSTGYSIITTGTSVARAIATLFKTVYSAGNQSNGNFKPVIEHNTLELLNPASGVVNFPVSGVVTWTPSRWGHGDDHTSLLSRIGSWGTTASSQRDPNDNAMLGDLVLASNTISGGNYLNFNGESRNIYFRKRDSLAPHLFSEQSGVLNLEGAALQVSKISNPASISASVGADITFGINGNPRFFYFKYSIFIDGVELVDSNYYMLDGTTGGFAGTLYTFNFSVAGLWWVDKIRIYGVQDAPNFNNAQYIEAGNAESASVTLNAANLAIWGVPGAPPNGPFITAKAFPSLVDLSNVVTTRSKLFNGLGINTNNFNGTSVLVDSKENFAPMRLIPNTSTISGDISVGSIFTRGATSSTGPATTGAGAAYISDGTYWNRVVTRNFPTAMTDITLAETFAETFTGQLGLATTVERVFPGGTHTIAPNTMTAGSGLRIRFIVKTLNHNASDTLTVRARYNGIGGTVLFSSGAITPAINDLMVFDGWIQFLSADRSSNSILGACFASVVTATGANTLAGSTDSTRALSISSSGTDFADALSRTLVITAQWNNANANNRVSLASIVIEKF